ERIEPGWNWLNITGPHKSGKTEFCVDLTKELKTFYFDFENGTVAYPGKFITIGSMAEFREKFAMASELAESETPDLVVLDPIDALEDMIVADYMKEQNIENLGEIPYGQGWADVRNKLQEVIQASMRLAASKLITITHVKLQILGEKRGNITFLDMNLTGKTKMFVQTKADGHCIFKRVKNDNGDSILAVDFDGTSTDEMSFAGSRFKKFHEVTTPQELKELIIKTTKGV
nr:AAA family ATPase [Candidatus Cloacimonadota bacterium]